MGYLYLVDYVGVVGDGVRIGGILVGVGLNPPGVTTNKPKPNNSKGFG